MPRTRILSTLNNKGLVLIAESKIFNQDENISITKSSELLENFFVYMSILLIETFYSLEYDLKRISASLRENEMKEH